MIHTDTHPLILPVRLLIVRNYIFSTQIVILQFLTNFFFLFSTSRTWSFNFLHLASWSFTFFKLSGSQRSRLLLHFLAFIWEVNHSVKKNYCVT